MHVVTNSLTSVLCISLLTLAHIGRAEGYCNQVFCVRVWCVFYQTFWTTTFVTTLELWSSYQQTWNYTRIKIKDRVFLKPFGYKVMTVFTTHDCRFITFWRLLVVRKQNSFCLKVIAVESQVEIKHDWSNDSYNTELGLSFCHDGHFICFISLDVRDWSHKTVL